MRATSLWQCQPYRQSMTIPSIRIYEPPSLEDGLLLESRLPAPDALVMPFFKRQTALRRPLSRLMTRTTNPTTSSKIRVILPCGCRHRDCSDLNATGGATSIRRSSKGSYLPGFARTRILIVLNARAVRRRGDSQILLEN